MFTKSVWCDIQVTKKLQIVYKISLESNQDLFSESVGLALCASISS